MHLERKIRADLQPFAQPKRAAHDVGYLNTALVTMGVPIPQVRKVMQAHCASWTPRERRERLDQLWKVSSVHEVCSVALYGFSTRKAELVLADWQVLKGWAAKVENWAHADNLSDALSSLLERYPEAMLPTLRRWNRSAHPWKRRLSLTALLYYARLRSVVLPVDVLLSFIEPRVEDEAFYVQRAVGWTLREVYSVYPKQAQAFLEAHVTVLPSITFTTAAERLPIQVKERLKEVRRQSRV